jgi:hypothetical protein
MAMDISRCWDEEGSTMQRVPISAFDAQSIGYWYLPLCCIGLSVCLVALAVFAFVSITSAASRRELH